MKNGESAYDKAMADGQPVRPAARMPWDGGAPSLSVSIAEISRYLRIGRRIPDGQLMERVVRLNRQAEAVVRPKCVWRRFGISKEAIVSGGIRLPICGTLARYMAGCREAYLVCGTIGTAFDALQRRVSTLSGADAFVMQAIGAAMIERLMDNAEELIRQELAPGEELISRYSPGYGTFPLSAQRELLALLDAPLSVGVSLTDTMLMVPSKSVSAIIGITNRKESHEPHST